MKDRNALDMDKIAGEFLIRYTQRIKEKILTNVLNEL